MSFESTMRDLEITVRPDYEALLKNLRRQGTPERTHIMELFLDIEVQDTVVKQFSLDNNLNKNSPDYELQRQIAVQRFLGFDYVTVKIENFEYDIDYNIAPDTAKLTKKGKRSWVVETKGVITDWRDFEKFQWPEPEDFSTQTLEWYQKNLPDDMCIVARLGHFCEALMWLMGYESLCFALHDQLDLVEAVFQKALELESRALELMLGFSRVEIVWASDDMGFKTGLFFSPEHMRKFVLAGHKKLAEMTHQAGKLYILHSCGNLKHIWVDLLEDVKIDAKHSFEDVILPVTDAKRAYGDRIALIGGIDVHLLCRADEDMVRRRVRETLEICHPGGGYALGTGNSVANYIPLRNYLTMLDEGRRFSLQ